MVGQLGVEQMEERLSYSVVPTVTLAAHTLYETTLGDPLDEATAGVLDPTIRVDEQAPWGSSQSHGSRPRRQHERGVQRRTQRPTDHWSRIQIDEDGQIQPAAPNPQVGDIAHPHLIGPLRGEVALQPIRCHRIPMLASNSSSP